MSAQSPEMRLILELREAVRKADEEAERAKRQQILQALNDLRRWAAQYDRKRCRRRRC